ncbi:MAG: hypothetical protein Q4B87_03390 [Candidatus Saccharibacteria bacterium]|nr:hypothetical protein [Candidatus Saccharibacteria bacterium]
MRSLEHSRSSGIDQAHIADDRNNIETRKHSSGTTWDDVASLKDQMGKLRSLIDDLPGIDDTAESINENNEKLEQFRSFNTIGDFSHASQKTHEQAVADARKQVLSAYSGGHETSEAETDRNTAIENVDRLQLPDNELIELTAEWGDVEINQEALQEATERNGNPNVHGRGLFFDSGNLPMSDDSVYRHVGTSAISDLMIQGFVRNKREAANALDKPGKSGFGTEGAGVYWHDGDSRKREKADLVIQASKAAAERGYVTKDDVQGIWVTDKNTGLPVNLIDGQDHTGLEIADHKR